MATNERTCVNAPEAFPFRVFASLPERADRRAALLPKLIALGLSARWIKPVSVEFIREHRGFRSLRKRSCALTKRIALRLAQRERAPSLLYFEDDLAFHPQFSERMAAIELPDDWGIFYFGCQHCETPKPVLPGLVRVARAFDFHACAIRAPHFIAARKIMRGAARNSAHLLHSDVLLSQLHATIPTYAAFPNLIWQAEDRSDLAGKVYSNYDARGIQRPYRHVIASILAGCV
jgi:hypothetical protein